MGALGTMPGVGPDSPALVFKIIFETDDFGTHLFQWHVAFFYVGAGAGLPLEQVLAGFCCAQGDTGIGNPQFLIPPNLYVCK